MTIYVSILFSSLGGKYEELLESEENTSDCILGFEPCYTGFDNAWIMILALMLLLDKPIEEKKESPVVINLYSGADE